MSENLRELIAINRDYFKPNEVARVLGCDPHAIRILARENRLGFPAVVMGSRVKIPRVPFLKFMGIEEPEAQTLSVSPKSVDE